VGTVPDQLVALLEEALDIFRVGVDEGVGVVVHGGRDGQVLHIGGRGYYGLDAVLGNCFLTGGRVEVAEQ
jgi:hypothetical protein